MKKIKANSTLIIGIIIALIVIIGAYFYLSSNKEVAIPPVPCAIGDRFDILTGKPCPPRIEEPDPSAGVKTDNKRG